MRKLTEHQRKNAKRVSAELDGAFAWDDTPQGGAYWSQVSQYLRELSYTPEPKRCPTCGHLKAEESE